MSEKRYHVFISSTYKDLYEERWEVAKVLLSHDCFVSGMEYFPSTGDEQFEYIKEVIDECDYYILILGGRYGSLAPDGVGYTEKEYNYAIEKGMKPIAFVFDKPNDLSPEKRENDPILYGKFCAFRERVLGKLSSLWGDINVLKVCVSESIARATKRTPAIGWVRANIVASAEVLTENRTLAKENEELRSEIESLKLQLEPNIENIAGLDEEINIQYTVRMPSSSLIRDSSNPISLRSIFCGLAPTIQNNLPRDSLFTKFQSTVRTLAHMDNAAAFYANRSDFETIMVHFEALGLVRIQYGKGVDENNYLFALLTELGKKTMTESLVFRKE